MLIVGVLIHWCHHCSDAFKAFRNDHALGKHKTNLCQKKANRVYWGNPIGQNYRPMAETSPHTPPEFSLVFAGFRKVIRNSQNSHSPSKGWVAGAKIPFPRIFLQKTKIKREMKK